MYHFICLQTMAANMHQSAENKLVIQACGSPQFSQISRVHDRIQR